MSLYAAANAGDLARVVLLVEQGNDKNEVGGVVEDTALGIAAQNDHLEVVRYLVEQSCEMEKAARNGWTPLINASYHGHLDVARYLLEQGADRDKTTNDGNTSLHLAALFGHLETTKLLMVYGADLDARNQDGKLPIDYTHNEEIKQAIRDEPRRRMDEAPGKRATEQDQHPNASASSSTASAQQQEEEEEEHDSKPPAEEGEVVADEDQDSEPSSDEEDDGY
jgi:hypothetical protein